MEKNYKLKDGRYLTIDETSNGYEYSLYMGCKTLLDGGVLELKGDFDEEKILKEILKLYDIPNDIGVVEVTDNIEEIKSIDKIFDEKKRREILSLFDENKEDEALEMIYKYTNDDIVKILLECEKSFKEELKNESSREYKICRDIFRYIIRKYETYHKVILI